MATSTVTPTALADELRRVVKAGWPFSLKTAGEVLPNLRSVVARSVHPDEAVSRLDALNELLARMVNRLGQCDDYRRVAPILFGVAEGSRGATLTVRRRKSAEMLGNDPDHFRKRVEPKIIAVVADALYRDLLRYKSRVKRAVSTFEPTGDTPSLRPEHLTAEEELVSRIWQHVYGLRAELIAHLRLQDKPAYEGQAEDHRQAALRQHDELRNLLQEYVKTYGKQLIQHGDVEYAVEGLERLAGWRG